MGAAASKASSRGRVVSIDPPSRCRCPMRDGVGASVDDESRAAHRMLQHPPPAGARLEPRDHGAVREPVLRGGCQSIRVDTVA